MILGILFGEVIIHTRCKRSITVKLVTNVGFTWLISIHDTETHTLQKFLCHWESQALQSVFSLTWTDLSSMEEDNILFFYPKTVSAVRILCWCKATQGKGCSPVLLSENLNYWEGTCSLSQQGTTARAGRKTPNAGWQKHWNIHRIRSAPSAGHFLHFKARKGIHWQYWHQRLSHWGDSLTAKEFKYLPCCTKLWGCTVWEITGQEKAAIATVWDESWDSSPWI